MKAKLKQICKSLSGELWVTFAVDSVNELNGLEDKEFGLEVHRTVRKRSLSANAYFHVLVGKIADKMAISKPRAKNILLGRYGQRWIENDKPLMISVVSECDMEEREDIHCIPVGYAELQGKKFTHYAVVRPSHEYDSTEMAHLIEGTVSEAKDLGIETMTPAELERMMKSWQSQYCRQQKNVTSAEAEADWSVIM